MPACSARRRAARIARFDSSVGRPAPRPLIVRLRVAADRAVISSKMSTAWNTVTRLWYPSGSRGPTAR